MSKSEPSMALPRYFIVGDRPVQFVPTADGGMDVQAFDRRTGTFVREMGYLTRCTIGDGEVDEVDEATFKAALRRQGADGGVVMRVEAGLATYDFVYNQHVELYLPGTERTVHARVLDMLPDDLLLRVLFDDDAEADPPPALDLGFGHKSWFYRAPVATKAFYGPCWFLERPDPLRAQKVQRRRFVRIHFKETFYALDTNIYGEPEGEPFGLRLENISASGCYAVPERADCAEYLMILLSLPGMSATYVVGRAIHRKPRPDGSVALGISFDGIPPGVQDDLVRVINAEIREHLKTGKDITV